MKIMLLTHHYAPEQGPSQRRWGALAARFTADHEVVVLTPTPHYPSGRRMFPENLSLAPGARRMGEYGEHIVQLPFVPHGRGLGRRTLDQFVGALCAVVAGIRWGIRPSRRPDVIIATAPALPTAGAGYAVGWALRRPVVLEFRDAWPDLIDHGKEWDATTTSIRWHPPARIGTLVVRYLTYLQSHCAAVVTTTESFADVLRRRGVHPVVVIRNGPKPPERIPEPAVHPHRTAGEQSGTLISGSDAEPGQRLRRVSGPLRVVYLGTVGRAQGLDHVVRAVARAHDLGVTVHLRIVGSGAAEPALRLLARELRVVVDFPGQVEQAQTRDHYDWADTAVVSLRAWKPLEWTVPSKLYELMQEGVHVTAVVGGEAADIVRMTEAGSVVAPGDVEGLARLWVTLASTGVPLPSAERTRAWLAEHAAYDQLAQTYLRVLDSVVDRG